MLSRERIACFTSVSSSEEVKILPEFVFKGVGTRTKINAPPNVYYQWSPSGSYRLEHLKKTISNLPNRYNMFSEDFAIYVLDDYAVHLMPEVRRALYGRGYVLVVMGGGITGDLQVNDTHTHRALKRHCKDEEAELMLSKLNENSHKIPSPDRSEIIDMTIKAWNKISVDYPRAFKQNFITCAFDGSKDYLVSDNIFRLVGEDMIEFRENLLRESVPNTLKSVVKNMIPPKGIRRNNVEVAELLDYMDKDCDENLEENASDEDSDLAEYGDTDEPVASTSNAEPSDHLSTAADSFKGPAHAGFVPL